VSIDYSKIFASNHFTRTQVDILRKLMEAVLAESGTGGAVSDNTKADKVTLIIAGSGLQGGGDLSANRTFAVDTSFFDARYPLIVDGKINVNVLPALPGRDTYTAASDAAMTALAAAKGDMCIRTDTPETFVLSALPASTLANWLQLPAAAGAVTAFNGRTGTITPAQDDYSFAQLSGKPTTRAGYGITDAEGIITATTTADYYRGDKTFQPLNKAAVGLGNVDNTADNSKPLGTTQLGTLAATGGAALVGHAPPGTGAIVRDLATQLDESAISLRAFALADGSDDTTRVSNWLNACVSAGRRGYAPAGDYSISDIAINADYLDIECHPLARFIGRSISVLGSELAASATSGSWNNLLNGGAAGTITGDGSGLHAAGANNLAGWTYNTALEDNTEYEVTYTMSGRTAGGSRVVLYGATNNHNAVGTTHNADGTYTERLITSGNSTTATNQIRIQCTGTNGNNTFNITAISVKKVTAGSANPLIKVTSATGSSSAQVGEVRWYGGVIDVSQRAYSNIGDAVGLKCINHDAVNVQGVAFNGATDHEAAITFGLAGSGLRTESCNNVTAMRNRFTGMADCGLAIVGGATTAVTDDGAGTTITNNHFIKCNLGWRATRQARNVVANGNEYRQCFIGSEALDETSVAAGRVSITGERYLKCGRYAIDAKQQVGCVIANNTIIDLGYKLDGTTAADGAPAAINLGGCVGANVQGNVIRMDALVQQTTSFGIVNGTYSATAPANNTISNNVIGGVNTGCYDDGTGSAITYRSNSFGTEVVNNYDAAIPAAMLPYGTYTPTMTPVTNIASTSPSGAQWRRIDKDVSVSVLCLIDPTASGAAELTCSLPIDPGADFTSDADLLGVAYSGTGGSGGHIIANTAVGARNARVLLDIGTDVANHTWGLTFTYRLGAGGVVTPPPGTGSSLTDEAGNFLTDEAANQLTT
jgi:hypothetical protein